MLIIPHSQWLEMSNFTGGQWGDFKHLHSTLSFTSPTPATPPLSVRSALSSSLLFYIYFVGLEEPEQMCQVYFNIGEFRPHLHCPLYS